MANRKMFKSEVQRNFSQPETTNYTSGDQVYFSELHQAQEKYMCASQPVFTIKSKIDEKLEYFEQNDQMRKYRANGNVLHKLAKSGQFKVQTPDKKISFTSKMLQQIQGLISEGKMDRVDTSKILRNIEKQNKDDRADCKLPFESLLKDEGDLRSNSTAVIQQSNLVSQNVSQDIVAASSFMDCNKESQSENSICNKSKTKSPSANLGDGTGFSFNSTAINCPELSSIIRKLNVTSAVTINSNEKKSFKRKSDDFVEYNFYNTTPSAAAIKRKLDFTVPDVPLDVYSPSTFKGFPISHDKRLSSSGTYNSFKDAYQKCFVRSNDRLSSTVISSKNTENEVIEQNVRDENSPFLQLENDPMSPLECSGSYKSAMDDSISSNYTLCECNNISVNNIAEDVPTFVQRVELDNDVKVENIDQNINVQNTGDAGIMSLDEDATIRANIDERNAKTGFSGISSIANKNAKINEFINNAAIDELNVDANPEANSVILARITHIEADEDTPVDKTIYPRIILERIDLNKNAEINTNISANVNYVRNNTKTDPIKNADTDNANAIISANDTRVAIETNFEEDDPDIDASANIRTNNETVLVSPNGADTSSYAGIGATKDMDGIAEDASGFMKATQDGDREMGLQNNAITAVFNESQYELSSSLIQLMVDDEVELNSSPAVPSPTSRAPDVAPSTIKTAVRGEIGGQSFRHVPIPPLTIRSQAPQPNWAARIDTQYKTMRTILEDISKLNSTINRYRSKFIRKDK